MTRAAGRRIAPPGWLVALAATAIAAWAASRLMMPRANELLPVAPVDARDLFSAEQLRRGRSFRRPQLAIDVAALAAQLVLLAILTRRRPAWLERRGRRPLRAAAAVGAAISGLLSVVVLPFAALARVRAGHVGLVTDTWAQWLRDRAVSAGLAALLAALAGLVVVALMRRAGRRWWLPASGVAVAATAVLLAAGPLIVDPLFNRFEPLPQGPVRSDLVRLGRAAGLAVGAVDVMDASRRTSSGNAYVAGLGPTKRIVVYDTVLRGFGRAEIRSIVAHELGHARYGDLWRGLAYVAVVAPFGLLAIASLTARLAPGNGARAAALPAAALAFVIVSTGVTWISNGLSQKVEARADAFALRLTRDPAAFVALQRRLAVRNVSDVDPVAPDRLLSTHPSVLDRIGMARAMATANRGSR